jgi:O-antigen ligase
MAADHPLDGVGQDGYVLIFHEYRDDVLPAGRAEYLATFRPESPHNVYLGFLNGGGVALLAAYLAVIATVGARLFRVLRSTADPRAWFLAAGIAAAIAGHLVTDLFMTAETTTSMLFWTFLGVVAGTDAPTHQGPEAARAPRAQFDSW